MISLQNNNKIIKYIIHIADIHIRRTEREKEYYDVFNELYKNLKGTIDCTNSIIVICGDILHDKINLHPISIRLTKTFFKLLSNLCDIIVIPGNHDTSNYEMYINNSIHCIITDLQTTNCIYSLTEHGLFEYNNIIFSHSSMHGNDIISVNNIKDNNKIKIALYHGIINGIKINNIVMNNKVKIEQFDGYDFVLLGDIHKHEFLRNNIAYSGSLIQQNIGEDTKKGYIIWDLMEHKGTFIQVKNKYAKIKININENGKTDMKITDICKYKNIELYIESKHIDMSIIDKIYKRIRDKNINIMRTTELFTCKKKYNTHILIGDSKKDITTIQNKIDVVDILMQRIDKSVSDNIRTELNKIVNNILDDNNYNTITKNVDIKLVNIKFNNAFIFGGINRGTNENKYLNIINFENFNNIIGLSDANSSGKSCIIDIILFIIFGENTRGERYDVINIYENNTNMEMEIEINNIKYKIIRRVKWDKKDRADYKNSAILKLYKFDTETHNDYIDITQDSITNTQIYINNLIECNAIQFINRCIITQQHIYKGQKIGFSYLTARQKRDLLCEISRLKVFDIIYDVCVRKLRELKIYIGKKNKLDKYKKYGTTLESIDNKLNIEISNLTTVKNTLEIEHDKYYKEKDEILKIIITYEYELSQLNGNLKKYIEYDNITIVIDERDKLLIENKQYNNQISELKYKINELTNKIDKIEKKKCKIKIEQIENELHNKLNRSFVSVDEYIYSMDIIIKNDRKIGDLLNELILNNNRIIYSIDINKSNILKKIKYNEKCKMCINNKKILTMNNLNDNTKLYKNIENINNEIEKIKKNNSEIENKLLNINIIENIENICRKEQLIHKKEEYMNLSMELNILNEDVYIMYEKLQKYESIIVKNKDGINKLNTKINKFSSDNGDNNFKKISQIRETILITQDKLDKLNKQKDNINCICINLLNKIRLINDNIYDLKLDYNMFKIIKDEIHEYQRQINIYEILSNTLNNGEIINNLLVNEVIPKFNDLVSNLFKRFNLRQIKMEIDNKNGLVIKDEFNVSLIRDGGFQSAINNIIYMIALSQFDDTLKTNFFIADEVFDSTDIHNKEVIKNIIEYLKSIYKWVLIISHDEEIRDVFDTQIEIQKHDILKRQKKIIFE